MAKKHVIDEDECMTCGAWAGICPEVFEIDEKADTASVIMETSGPEDLIQEAMDNCPVECINWED